GDKHEKSHGDKHHGVHWGYEGDSGPEHWGDLSEKFKACGEGKSQSPIDISGELKAPHDTLEMNYDETKINILNNGHSIKVNYDKGSYITVNGERYNLVQFHFHGPSEHTVNGKHAAMEMHLVHQSKKGAYAVVGALIEKGDKNKAFSTMWKNLPEEAGEKESLKATVNVKDLLPAKKAFYNYSGSFTTPPCTEDVTWFVMKDKVNLSEHQLKTFGEIMHGDNRPVQPLNGRVIGASGL
ncbi:MAG: carbonic anhydrase, partial [Thermodesulfobacteriota bacterium]